MPKTAPDPCRGTKRQRTQDALIAAAAALIAEQGYERTSLEQVAARAGMTRGAIYGNFRNKEDLFLAVVATQWQPILPAIQPSAGLNGQMNALADAVITAMPARRAAAVGAASFQIYALTHETMRERIEATNAEIYRKMAEGLESQFGGGSLPMAPAMFVRVMHALIDGLMFLHALTPELIDESVVRAALQTIVGQDKKN